jgi:hypothetical protein
MDSFMKILLRWVLFIAVVSAVTGCDTVILSPINQPPPVPVMVQPSAVAYPAPVPSMQVSPEPIQTPPLPASVPSNMPVQPIYSAPKPATATPLPSGSPPPPPPSSNVIPVRGPNSISELPDPS